MTDNQNINKPLVQGDSIQTIAAFACDSSISLQQKQLKIMIAIIDVNENSDII